MAVSSQWHRFLAGENMQIEIETRKKLKDNPLCCCCGVEYDTQQNNFFHSDSPIFSGNKGFFRMCKSCTEKYYNDLVKKFRGNAYSAMERMCQIFDIYYNSAAFTSVLEKNTDGNIMTAYIKKMQLFQYKKKTYNDTILETAPKFIDTVKDVQKQDDSSMTKKAVGTWGYGFSIEEYNTLNDMFDDWKTRVIIDSKTKEALIQELCIIKLQLNAAIRENNINIYIKMVKTYIDTMKSANIQPLQEDASDREGEKPIGVMIKMFENERPIQKCRPEWEDVDGIVKYITIYFLGHLSAMLKLKNKYAYMYQAEMEKYRSKNPFLNGKDDEEVFTSMFVKSDVNGII